MAAAVGSLIIRITLSPAIVPASLVAALWASLKSKTKNKVYQPIFRRNPERGVLSGPGPRVFPPRAELLAQRHSSDGRAQRTAGTQHY